MLAAFDYGDTMALCVLDDRGDIVLNCQSTDFNYMCHVLSFYKLDYFVCESIVGKDDEDRYHYQLSVIKNYLGDAKILSIKPHQWKHATESKISITTKHFIECTRFAKFVYRKLSEKKINV